VHYWPSPTLKGFNMSVLTLVFWLFKYGPTVYTIISEILELIKQFKDDSSKPMLNKALAESVDYYARTKDRSRLRKLRADLRKKLGVE